MKRLIAITLFIVGCGFVQNDSKEQLQPTPTRGVTIDSVVLDSTPEKISETESIGISKSNRFALIIANGDYMEETKWLDISSLSDIEIVKEALLMKGFQEDHITVVTNADYDAMNKAFTDFTTKLVPEAVAVVHYSGHGQQIFDDNGDEVDGYDEAIIPIDAYANYNKDGYKGARHMRDEKTGTYLKEMRRKLGPNGQLMVVLDACHSGTGTRGNAKHRGTATAFAPENYSPNEEKEKAYGIYEEDVDIAPMVCFYGASPNELNYEYEVEPGIYVGSLSFAFSKALSEATPNTTYRALFDNIRLTMISIAPRQTPMSEGLSDQQVLGGDILPPVNYYSVVNITTDESGTFVTLNGGKLMGLYETSKVAFYPIGTYDISKAKPFGKGTIIFSNLMVADVEMEGTFISDELVGAWVLVDEQNYGELSISVKLDVTDSKLKNAINSKLEGYELIKVVDEDPDLFVGRDPYQTRGNKNVLDIYSKQDEIIWSEDISNKETDVVSGEIVRRIIDFTQKRFLRKLEMETPELKTTFEIQPLIATKRGARLIVDSILPIKSKISAAGSIVFNDGDYFQIKITNEGSKLVYFSLLDIQPDDQINVLIPERNVDPSNYALGPGKEYISPPISVAPPYGIEVFKLIATEEPLNLSAIIRTRGSATRGPGGSKNPFAVLVSDSFMDDETTTRGGGTDNMPTGSVHIASYIFDIAPN